VSARTEIPGTDAAGKSVCTPHSSKAPRLVCILRQTSPGVAAHCAACIAGELCPALSRRVPAAVRLA